MRILNINIQKVPLFILFVLQVGERLRLVCNFSLGTDQLYSVKWYKDNMEFYR